MTAELKKRIDEIVAEKIKLIDDNSEQIFYLWGRWQDEKEYEDIKDYLIPINKWLPEASHMTKRPFGFRVRIQFDKVVIYGEVSVKRKGSCIQVFREFKAWMTK